MLHFSKWLTRQLICSPVIWLTVLLSITTGVQLEVEPLLLKGLENDLLNFTLELKPSNQYQGTQEIRLFFETDAKYFNYYSKEKGQLIEIPETVNQEKYIDVHLDTDKTVEIQMNSSLIGIYYLRFYAQINGLSETKTYFEENTMSVVIGRDHVQVNKGINIGFTLLLIVALFFMGLEIDLKLVLQVVKRPIGPVIGMVCQFLFMPLCAYGLGEWLLSQDYEKLGLLLLGSSPGGAPSNFWTAMFGGDINLSVTMTLLSSVASFAMTSLWVYVLGRSYSSNEIQIPYAMIALSLVSFVIPMAVGVYVKHKKENLANRIQALLSRPFFLLCLIVLPTVGISNSLYFFYLVTWRHLLSGFLLGALGYVFGAGLAWICRQERPQIIAISLETAIQNGGIAFVVLSLTFESPYSDVGVMPVIAFFICSTGPILFVVYTIYEIYRCATGKNSLDEMKKKFRAAKDKARGESQTEQEKRETQTDIEETDRILKQIEKETDIV